MEVNRKRNRQISFRLSDQEYKNLQLKSEILSLSIPQFCKDVALSKKIREPKIDNKGALQIASELRRIGNNVNQVAKHLNSGLNVSEGQIKALQEELGELWQAFNSAIQK